METIELSSQKSVVQNLNSVKNTPNKWLSLLYNRSVLPLSTLVFTADEKSLKKLETKPSNTYHLCGFRNENKDVHLRYFAKYLHGQQETNQDLVKKSLLLQNRSVINHLKSLSERISSTEIEVEMFVFKNLLSGREITENMNKKRKLTKITKNMNKLYYNLSKKRKNTFSEKDLLRVVTKTNLDFLHNNSLIKERVDRPGWYEAGRRHLQVSVFQIFTLNFKIYSTLIFTFIMTLILIFILALILTLMLSLVLTLML